MNKTMIVLLSAVALLLACSDDKNPVSPEQSQYILTGYNKAKIDSLMHLIDATAGLTTIWSDDVGPDGTSMCWMYQFMSSADTMYHCHANITEAVYDSCTYGFFVGGGYITHNWFDSDSALQIAEGNGGRDFRARHPDYRIEASLYEPVMPETSTYWYIKYRAQSGDDILGIIVDAVSGEIRYPE